MHMKGHHMYSQGIYGLCVFRGKACIAARCYQKACFGDLSTLVSLVDSPSSSLNKIPAPNFSFKAFKVKPALSKRISTLMLESMDLVKNR